MLVKSRKIHKCDYCSGNIQKGEIHEHIKMRIPKFDSNDKQIGIEYYQYRHHIRDCFARLLHFTATKEILKNCNNGIHYPTWDRNPDSYDDKIWCEWCGRELKSCENPIAIN